MRQYLILNYSMYCHTVIFELYTKSLVFMHNVFEVDFLKRAPLIVMIKYLAFKLIDIINRD